MNIACIYHKVDFDGVCSALLVDYFHKSHEITFIGWNYGMDVPELGEYDGIILVDISLPAENMKKLYNERKESVIWIDHHRTSLESAIEYGYCDFPGSREEGKAGCELTWEFFSQQSEIPKFVRLLGRYDVWDKSGKYFDWDTEILPFQYGVKHKFGMSVDNMLPYVNDYLDGGVEFEKLIELGNSLLNYQLKRWESQVKKCAFPVTVAGKYKGIALLTPDGGSVMFSSVLDEYDIYITVNRKTKEDGNQRYFLSMYSEPGRLDFSLGNYVKSFGLGGGGHPTACGSDISEEQFISLIVDHEI